MDNFNRIFIGTTPIAKIAPIAGSINHSRTLLIDSEDSVNEIGKDNLSLMVHRLNNGVDSANDGIGFARKSIHGYQSFKKDENLNRKIRELTNGNTLVVISPPGATGTAGYSHLIDNVENGTIDKGKIKFVFPLSATEDEIGERKIYEIFMTTETIDCIDPFSVILTPNEKTVQMTLDFLPKHHQLISADLINRINQQEKSRPYLIIDPYAKDILELKNDFTKELMAILKKRLLEGNHSASLSGEELRKRSSEIMEAVEGIINFGRYNLIGGLTEAVEHSSDYGQFKEGLQGDLSNVALSHIVEDVAIVKERIYTLVKEFGYVRTKQLLDDILKWITEESEKLSFPVAGYLLNYYKQQKFATIRFYHKLKRRLVNSFELESKLKQAICGSVLKELEKGLHTFSSFMEEDKAACETIPGFEEVVEKILETDDVLFDELSRANKIERTVEKQFEVLLEQFLLNITKERGFLIENKAKQREGIIIESEHLSKANPKFLENFKIRLQRKFDIIQPEFIRLSGSEDNKLRIIFWVAAFANEINLFQKISNKLHSAINLIDGIPPLYNSLRDLADVFPPRHRIHGKPEPEDLNTILLCLLLTPKSSVFRKGSLFVKVTGQNFNSRVELENISLTDERKILRNFYEYFLKNKKEAYKSIELLTNNKRTETHKNVDKFIGPRKLKETINSFMPRLRYLEELNEKA